MSDDHAHAELPEDVRDPGVVAQRLDAFEGEHEPDPAVERVEIGRLLNHRHVVRALASCAVERLHLRERAAQGELGEILELDEDRAHLHPDTACAELRQPVRRERPLLLGAERQLEEEVVVRVDDHRAERGRRVRVGRSVGGEDDAEHVAASSALTSSSRTSRATCSGSRCRGSPQPPPPGLSTRTRSPASSGPK